MTPTKFAGFTRLEWIAAYSRVMPAEYAVREITELFATLEHEGTNGHGLSIETWALLGATGPEAEGRVLDVIHDYPSVFRDSVRKTIQLLRLD